MDGMRELFPKEGRKRMCDYSLMGVPNRLANEQEDLVAHRFPTGSLGLASPADVQRLAHPATGRPRGIRTAIKEFFNPPELAPVAAVCIPPGARLWLRDIPERLQSGLDVAREEAVVFTQTGAAVNTYRDALRFSNGRVLRLQDLREGQRVRVLDLSMAEASEPVIEEFLSFR
jgi:hypothetical protein